MKKNNHQIVQVINRTLSRARALGDALGCESGDFAVPLHPEADLFIVAIADNALFSLDQYLAPCTQLLVHTAGSVPLSVFSKITSRQGVFYPLQSLVKGSTSNTLLPLLIDAAQEADRVQLQILAESISDRVEWADDEKRLRLHTAAVVVNNFTNHLYALTSAFCQAEEVDFSLLQPLIEETALRLRQRPPAELQTGPAIRNDVFTLDKHLKVLTAHPRLKYLYVKLTDSIMSRD
jgi:predicted short-subunit dehydrogenase-like oxidoreductase (DUF2520 family)